MSRSRQSPAVVGLLCDQPFGMRGFAQHMDYTLSQFSLRTVRMIFECDSAPTISTSRTLRTKCHSLRHRYRRYLFPG